MHLSENGVERRVRALGDLAERDVVVDSERDDSALFRGKRGDTVQQLLARFLGAQAAVGGLLAILDFGPIGVLELDGHAAIAAFDKIDELVARDPQDPAFELAAVFVFFERAPDFHPDQLAEIVDIVLVAQRSHQKISKHGAVERDQLAERLGVAIPGLNLQRKRMGFDAHAGILRGEPCRPVTAGIFWKSNFPTRLEFDKAMRILLVEDHPRLKQSLARALRKEGYAVDEAEDGEEGLAKAEDYDYDALVLDVMLPKLDGWTVLERLRHTKKTPVLMLTARDSVADRVRGLDAGADDYLAKPFEMPELLARLRALIRRAAGQAGSEIDLGDFTLDLKGKKLRKKGEAVAVTAEEFKLIEFLALHRGKVISRTQLYEHLFDESEASMSNILDVKVSRIRTKLGKDFITTHRGLGYSIG